MIFSFNNCLFDDLNGKIEYCCDNCISSHAAFEKGKSSVIRLFVPRCIGALTISLILRKDDSSSVIKLSGEWNSLSNEFDIYNFDLTNFISDTGLFFFDIVVNSFCLTLYCRKHNDTIFFSKDTEQNSFQLIVSDFQYSIPEKHLGGIIYHIFVDRFMKSGQVIESSDRIVVNDWTKGIPEFPEYPGAPMKNNTFYGGTLYGVAERLDYLKELGVSLIYLSPIFESPSNHKYDTSDYMRVDLGFGGDKALEFLISEAKKRDIGIILDGVFNHTGDDSIYFNKYSRYNSIGAFQSKDSLYYSWYDFQDYPQTYTSWWGIEILPRINTDVESCKNFFLGDNGVIEKYSSMGISGFRLDVADELSDSFIEGVKKVMSNYTSDSILYGEVWEDASNKIAYSTRKKYYLGKELDGVMNYPIREGIIDFLRNKRCEKMKYALNDIIFNAPKRIADLQMNLLGSHDTERILTALGGKNEAGYTNSELKDLRLDREEYKFASKLLKQAYTILATLPGLPTIFYGDEVGLEGYRDPFNRMPYPWNNEDLNLKEHFITTGRIRKSNSVYKSGQFKVHYLSNQVLIFSRNNKEQYLITVINNSDTTIKLTLNSDSHLCYSNKKCAKGEFINIPECGFEILSTKRLEEITIY